MKKLELDRLSVESFATTAETAGHRGTIAARENTGTAACENSWQPNTCLVTCTETCEPCTEAEVC